MEGGRIGILFWYIFDYSVVVGFHAKHAILAGLGNIKMATNAGHQASTSGGYVCCRHTSNGADRRSPIQTLGLRQRSILNPQSMKARSRKESTNSAPRQHLYLAFYSSTYTKGVSPLLPFRFKKFQRWVLFFISPLTARSIFGSCRVLVSRSKWFTFIFRFCPSKSIGTLKYAKHTARIEIVNTGMCTQVRGSRAVERNKSSKKDCPHRKTRQRENDAHPSPPPPLPQTPASPLLRSYASTQLRNYSASASVAFSFFKLLRYFSSAFRLLLRVLPASFLRGALVQPALDLAKPAPCR